MSDILTVLDILPPSTHYVSMTSLRTVHKQLLASHRQYGSTPRLLTEAIAFIERGKAIGAWLDNDTERAAAQSILDYWYAILYRSGSESPDSALAEFDLSLAPELPDELCPYVGLDAFSETKQGVFFGRERLVEAAARMTAKSRLLVVVGPSGSGKSSLVLAGLLPVLKEGAVPGSEGWRYAPRMVPGSDPMANLARALYSLQCKPEQDAEQWTAQHAALLTLEPGRLPELLERDHDAAALLVVDQFEEVFTLCVDDAARRAFVAALTALFRQRGHRHTVVLTMRTDFESLVSRIPDFHAQFERHLLRVTPLNAAELRTSITAPAELVGLKFEQGLVDTLLEDILGEPAALPLLQFTLLKLWEHREHNYITWDAYRCLGGGRLALANSADALYDGLIPEEQITARRILLRLVRAGDGLEITSSRVRLDSLYRSGEADDRVDRVLAKLISARLVRLTPGEVTSDTQVEVAHEALVRNWPRLVAWLEEDREIIRQRQRLTDAAQHWAMLDGDAGALLSETLLQEATRFLDVTGVALSGLELEFLQASRQAIVAERERELARQAELKRAHVEAQLQAAKVRRLRALAISLSLLLIIPALLVALKLQQRDSRWQPMDAFPRDTVSTLSGSWHGQGGSGAELMVCAGTSNIGIGCTQSGRTWNIYQQDLPTGDPAFSDGNEFAGAVRGVQAMTVDSRNFRRIYAFFWDGKLYRSDNGGVRWRQLDAGLPTNQSIARSIASYGDSVMAIVGSELYGSQDAGEHWQDLGRYSQPFWGQVHDIYIDAAAAEAYAATDNGVYMTSLAASWQWQRLINLPDVVSIVQRVGGNRELMLLTAGSNQGSVLYLWTTVQGLRTLASFTRPVHGLTADPTASNDISAYVLLDSGEVLAVSSQGTKRSLGLRPDWPWDHALTLLAVPDATSPGTLLLLGHTSGLFQYTGNIAGSMQEGSAESVPLRSH